MKQYIYDDQGYFLSELSDFEAENYTNKTNIAPPIDGLDLEAFTCVFDIYRQAWEVVERIEN